VPPASVATLGVVAGRRLLLWRGGAGGGLPANVMTWNSAAMTWGGGNMTWS
jgi:hypothetical protein